MEVARLKPRPSAGRMSTMLETLPLSEQIRQLEEELGLPTETPTINNIASNMYDLQD